MVRITVAPALSKGRIIRRRLSHVVQKHESMLERVEAAMVVRVKVLDRLVANTKPSTDIALRRGFLVVRPVKVVYATSHLLLNGWHASFRTVLLL